MGAKRSFSDQQEEEREDTEGDGNYTAVYMQPNPLSSVCTLPTDFSPDRPLAAAAATMFTLRPTSERHEQIRSISQRLERSVLTRPHAFITPPS